MQRSLFNIASTIRRSAPLASWLASPPPAAAPTVVAPRHFSTLFSSSTIASPKIALASVPRQQSRQQQHQDRQRQQTRHRSSRSLRGLYDGKDVRFGNNVPFSMKKTRRRWNPNVQFKRIYSEILDEMIPFHVTTSALRSIDKYGGLDEYLLRSPMVSTKGEGEGQRVRNRIVQKMKHRAELKKKALARGESVDDWDKIVLVGKKMKGSAAATADSSSSGGDVGGASGDANAS